MRIRISWITLCFITCLAPLWSGCTPTESEPPLPPSDTLAIDTTEVMQTGQNLLSTLDDDGRFSTLIAAFDSSGLGTTINAAGPFTLFAPTDLAFDQLQNVDSEELLSPDQRPRLQDLLMNHVINGRRTADDIRVADTVETMYGDELTIVDENGALRVAGTNVTETDLQADNGIIHVVDAVILPRSLLARTTGDGPVD